MNFQFVICNEQTLKKTFIYFRFFQNYTSKKSNACESMAVYRYVQLLANLSNDIQQKGIIPGPLVECTILSGVGLAFLVQTSVSTKNLPFLIVLAFGCFDCVLFLLLCLGTFAMIYKESRITLEKIRLNAACITPRKERRWTRRFLRSCEVLKIKFGGNNFVEELTPLNCLSHALQICVQTLLLRRTN